MKKLAILLVAAAAAFGTAKADDDKVVSVAELPATAQAFIKKHFSEKKVAVAKADIGLFSNEYDVIFTDGSKVEFEDGGNWTEVKCRNVPTAIVPGKILSYLKANYGTPDVTIVMIERTGHGYEVKISTGLELEFNKNLELVDIDD